MAPLAALLLGMASAPASTSLAGVYEIHQIEMAGGLELRRDGHFSYDFSYGALDEESAGEWVFDGRRVLLTSNPMPRMPSFELVRDDPAPKGELYMRLEDPGFAWGEPLHALATDKKQAFEIAAGEDGRVDLQDKPPVLAIAPLMPVYGPTNESFRIDPRRGHRLLFRFHKNDLGKAAFKNEPLEVGPEGLLMNRYDTQIRFIRVGP